MSPYQAQREVLDKAARRLCEHCAWEHAWRDASLEAKSSLTHVAPGIWRHQFARPRHPYEYRDCGAAVIHELGWELATNPADPQA